MAAQRWLMLPLRSVHVSTITASVQAGDAVQSCIITPVQVTHMSASFAAVHSAMHEIVMHPRRVRTFCMASDRRSPANRCSCRQHGSSPRLRRPHVPTNIQNRRSSSSACAARRHDLMTHCRSRVETVIYQYGAVGAAAEDSTHRPGNVAVRHFLDAARQCLQGVSRPFCSLLTQLLSMLQATLMGPQREGGGGWGDVQRNIRK